MQRFDFSRPIIGDRDFDRLARMDMSRVVSEEHRNLLKAEIEKAQLVSSDIIPRSVISMNSRVLLRDLETGKHFEVTLVYPLKGDVSEGRVSVTSKLGLALLGETEGKVIDWELANGGVRRVLVVGVPYQPESAGEEE